MKKSLKKVIVTLAAISALTAAMAVTASAAVSTTQTTTDGKTTVTATVTGKSEGEQVTMLILKPGADTTNGVQEGEIAYIDQKAADKDGNVTFTMPIGETKEKDTYSVLSGSDKADAPDTGTVTIGGSSTALNYGDVTGEGKLTNVDGLQILMYKAGKTGSVLDSVVEGSDLWNTADVTGEGKLTNVDGLQILMYKAGKTVNDDIKARFAWTEAK